MSKEDIEEKIDDESDSTGLSIEESDFKLIALKNSIFWNLGLKRIVKAKKSEPYEKIEITNYGVTLDYAMKLIIQNRLSKKFDCPITMREYLDEWKSMKETLTKEVDGSL